MASPQSAHGLAVPPTSEPFTRAQLEAMRDIILQWSTNTLQTVAGAVEKELVPLRSLQSVLADTKSALQEQIANLATTVAEMGCKLEPVAHIDVAEPAAAPCPVVALFSSSKRRRTRRNKCAQDHCYSRDRMLQNRGKSFLPEAGVASASDFGAATLHDRVANLEIIVCHSSVASSPVGVAGIEWGEFQSAFDPWQEWRADTAWSALEHEFESSSAKGGTLWADAPTYRPTKCATSAIGQQGDFRALPAYFWGSLLF